MGRGRRRLRAGRRASAGPLLGAVLPRRLPPQGRALGDGPRRVEYLYQPAAGFVWAYLFRSFAHEKLHALPEAEADFDKALKLDPSDDARYVLYQTRGILRFNQGALDQAAADFRAATALQPAQYNAYLNLAHVSLAQGRFDEAES